MGRMDEDGRQEFYAGRVTTADNMESALIWIVPEFLEIITTTEDINMDATFKTVPDLFSQLATIHMVKYNQVSFIPIRVFFNEL